MMVLTMRLTTLAKLVGLTLTTLTLSSAWALDKEAQAAKDEGMRLYNALQREESIPYLEIAAEAGDIDAMFCEPLAGVVLPCRAAGRTLLHAALT